MRMFLFLMSSLKALESCLIAVVCFTTSQFVVLNGKTLLAATNKRSLAELMLTFLTWWTFFDKILRIFLDFLTV